MHRPASLQSARIAHRAHQVVLNDPSTRGDSFHGVHSFQFLDTAKTFAMLRVRAMEHAIQRAMEHAIQDNLDRIQVYNGSAK